MKQISMKRVTKLLLLLVLAAVITIIPASARYRVQFVVSHGSPGWDIERFHPEHDLTAEELAMGFDIIYTAPIFVTPGTSPISTGSTLNNMGAQLTINNAPAGWYAFRMRGGNGGVGHSISSGNRGYGGLGAYVQGIFYFDGGTLLIRAGKAGPTSWTGTAANRNSDRADWGGGNTQDNNSGGGGGGYSGIFIGSAASQGSAVAIAGGGGGGASGGSAGIGSSLRHAGNGGAGGSGAGATGGAGGNASEINSGPAATALGGTGTGGGGGGGGAGRSGGGGGTGNGGGGGAGGFLDGNGARQVGIGGGGGGGGAGNNGNHAGNGGQATAGGTARGSGHTNAGGNNGGNGAALLGGGASTGMRGGAGGGGYWGGGAGGWQNTNSGGGGGGGGASFLRVGVYPLANVPAAFNPPTAGPPTSHGNGWVWIMYLGPRRPNTVSPLVS